jgi:hypothetical protein
MSFCLKEKSSLPVFILLILNSNFQFIIIKNLATLLMTDKMA